LGVFLGRTWLFEGFDFGEAFVSIQKKPLFVDKIGRKDQFFRRFVGLPSRHLK